MKKKRKASEHIFDKFNAMFMILISMICLYPIYYCLMASLSTPSQLAKAGAILLYPKGLQFGSYYLVFRNSEILFGYMNTLGYVIIGTLINVVLSLMGAYVLSRKQLRMKRFFNLMITITMFVDGGMIPLYLLVKSLGLLDSRWALILPTAIVTYNMIMARTYFYSIPDSLEESAKLDGAGDTRIFINIMIPLAKPIIAVLTLYYAVGHWNSWFPAMLYLTDRNKYPVQLFLREILIQSQVGNMMPESSELDSINAMAENIKYATVIVVTLPILCVYPFVQKYFVKGVMIGAVKG